MISTSVCKDVLIAEFRLEREKLMSPKKPLGGVHRPGVWELHYDLVSSHLITDSNKFSIDLHKDDASDYE